MKTGYKIAIGTLSVGAILSLTSWGIKLKRLSEQVETIPSARLHKMDTSGLVIKLDVRIKNPTTTSLSLDYPFIKLYYQDVLLGSTTLLNKRIEVPKQGEAVISDLTLSLSYMSLLTAAKKLLEDINNGHGIKLKAKVSTRLHFLKSIITLPYSSESDIILKK